LVDFKAMFYFDSGRSDDIFTYDGFRTYRNISSDVCVGVELSWTYLVKFPSKELPEKQQIDFIITVDEEYKERKLESKYSFRNYISLASDKNAIVRIVIEYSDFTWGEDILSHVARYVESSLKKPDLVARSIRYLIDSFLIAVVVGLILFPLSFYMEQRLFPFSKIEILKTIDAALTDTASTLEVQKALLEWAKYTIGKVPYTFFVSFTYVVLMFMAFLFGIGLRSRSFIIVNEYSSRLHAHYKNRIYLIQTTILLSFVVGLIASFFASKLYDIAKILGVM